MNIVGTIRGGTAQPLTPGRSFEGTSALDDAVVFDALYQPFSTNLGFRVAFTSLVEDSQGLKYTVFDWPRSTYEVYRLPQLDSPQAIELISAAGSTVPAAVLSAGDYRQTPLETSSIIAGSAQITEVYAPTPTSGGNMINGGPGNDRLVGSSVSDAFNSWSGINTLEGGLGNDGYRIILGHPDQSAAQSDTIIDAGGAFDELRILVDSPRSDIFATRSGAIWWNLKREADDLVGEIFSFASGTEFTDAELRRDPEGYSFRIQDHYTADGAVEFLRIFGEGEQDLTPIDFTLSSFNQFPTGTANSSGSVFAGTDSGDLINLSLSGASELARVNTYQDRTFWVFGNGGDDQFVRPANVPNIRFLFEGGAGLDTVSYSESRADVILSGIESQTVLGPRVQIRGSETPQAVRPDSIYAERIVFSDEALALDTRGNAGQVAKILGAVFGSDSVQNKVYAGIGLKLLDDGMSYEALNDLAIRTALGPSLTNPAVVNLLYSNVVGVSPSAQELAFYENLLDQGLTIGAIGALAADTEINMGNIKLTGLYQTGLAYIPF